MKQMLMMIVCMLLSVALHATTELVLDVNESQVTYYSSDYYSQEDWYCHHVVLQHKSEDPRDEFPILTFTIYQTTNKGLVSGKYNLDDENLSEVVLTRDLYEAIAQEQGVYTWTAISADAEVVVNKDGTTTIKVAIEDAKGVKYSAELTKKIQVVESKQHPYNDPYIYENQKASEFEVTMDSLIWDDSQFYNEKTMQLKMLSKDRKPDGTFYSTVLWINTASQIPTAGTYPIEGMGKIGTVDASIGYDPIQNIIYPSYFGLSDDLGRMYDPELYFLVMGKVEISYPAEDVIRIEVDATSWWKSHVKCVYEGKIGYLPAETKTYDVTLGEETDLMNKSYPGVYEYSIQMNGTDADGVTYSVYIDLLPEQDKLVGEYSRANRTFYTDGSAIQRGKESARHIADGAISVTMDEKGLYAIQGYMIDMQGDRFNIQGEGIVIEFVSEEAYRYELENTKTTTIKTVFSDIIWDQSTVERDQYLTITLVNKKANSNGLKEKAVFWMSTPTAVFPAGEYPINNTADFLTFYASPGNDGGGISPCLYYTYDEKKGIQEVWFLTDGEVTIDYPTDKTISVEVHATSYFGSEINLYYNVQGVGVEEVENDKLCNISVTSSNIHQGSVIAMLNDNTIPNDTIIWSKVDISLHAVPDDGYHFTQWSDGNTNNPRTFVLTQDTTFVAEFERNSYSVSVASTDLAKGSVVGDTTVLYQEQVTIMANPALGFQFNGWSDGNTDNPRVVTVTRDVTYMAYFGAKMCTLTIISNIEEAADITGAGIYEYGTAVSCAVDVMTDYTFVKWGNGKTANPYKFKIYDDMTLYAFFAEEGGEPIAPDSVIVLPTDNDATLQWPQVDNATSYTMTITKGGETICTLTFNGLGQLINIDFSAAPARAAASAKVASATTGFNFTVTGLAPGTTYGYLIEAKDEKGEVISTEEGTFTTTGEITAIEEATVNKYVNTVTKLLRDGQLLILRDGKTYNIQGAQVK